MKIKITEFAKRHFKNANGTVIKSHTVEEVEEYLEDVFRLQTEYRVDDGYADFCKLLFVPNFTDAKIGTMEITNENYQYLRSSYKKRRKGELPVLTRHFNLPLEAPKAEYLVFVLYSIDQLKKEHANSETDDDLEFEFEGQDVEYGVVAILGQELPLEEPMTPATMIRNHLGTEFGGSGKELNEDEYMHSVDFWNTHAIIKHK